jgi:hypothetical protein
MDWPLWLPSTNYSETETISVFFLMQVAQSIIIEKEIQMANSNYVLIARGSMSMPQLEIDVQGSKSSNAIELAKLMVVHLAKAGYISFELFDIRTEDHVRVARVMVETPDPIVRVV